ncbi:MAG: patatin-like phospholipase family protein [Chlorobium sp.]|nr:patatin-like phospholipase family protein [Chlorobium sp.]
MAYRVLSINGGGMRGIYAAAYLEALENSFKHRLGKDSFDIGKGFDLIVGTSTGAIIGCGLAIGMHPSEIVKLYKDKGQRIFPQKLPSVKSKLDFSGLADMMLQLFNRPSFLRQGEEALRTALSEAFGDTTIKQVWDERKIALAITAVKMSNYKPYVFKTPHNIDSNGRDSNLKLVDVCLASSAAPLYRSLAAIDSKSDGAYEVFTDGGLWANNPVMVALIEALRILENLDRKDKSIEIYCLGSCGKPDGIMIEKDNLARGLQGWKFGGDAAQVSISAQENAFDFIADEIVKYLDRDIKIISFPSGQVNNDLMQYLDLDETREIGLLSLISKANTDADETNNFIRNYPDKGQLIIDLYNSMPQRN